jgi:hypothetical protein
MPHLHEKFHRRILSSRTNRGSVRAGEISACAVQRVTQVFESSDRCWGTFRSSLVDQWRQFIGSDDLLVISMSDLTHVATN